VRVLVTGSTGNVGRYVVKALVEHEVEVRAAVRPGSADHPDAPSVPLDFEDASTWEAALDGIDGLFLLRPPAISDVRRTLNAFVDRGRDALQHVVFLSVAGAESNSVIPHAKVEAHLQAGDTPWTFLRASFFAQNVCGPYRVDIRDDDRIYVPAGRQAVSWVDTRDLGEAAALAFLDPDARNQAWTLTGAETRTFDEVAALLTRYLDRPIQYVPATIAGYLYHLRRRRELPWGAAIVYMVLHTAIRLGAENRIDPTLEGVLGRAPRTIEDTIRDHVALWER